MSVRQYDEEPFPYQVEHYDGLERGQWIEVRQNDVKLPVGSRGVVLKKIAETGNYQVAVEVEGEAQKRVVALCQDQVRPIEPPLPEPEAEGEPEKTKRAASWTPEKRAEQAQRVKEMWARKKAEREAAEAAAKTPKRRTAPADIEERIAATSAKLAEQAAGILNMPKERADEVAPSLMTRHRPEGMDERIAEAVHGPERPPRKLTERPAPEPVAAAEPDPEPAIVTELADAIRHVQGYRETYAPNPSFVLSGAMPEPETLERFRTGDVVTTIRLSDSAIVGVERAVPKLEALTWTKRAADAIRPVLAEAAAAGGDVTQLALLVETISYLEDGGRP